MLKNILKLEGAQQLSNVEKKSINGGLMQCMGPDGTCKYTGKYCAEQQCKSIILF